MKKMSTLVLVLILSSCTHRFFVPHYIEDHHIEEVIQIMVDQYFDLKPYVGSSISVNPSFRYSEFLAATFREKGYSVSESVSGYQLDFHTHDTEKESDTHMLIASLNRKGETRFNMLFEVHGDIVVPSATSVQQL